MTVDLSAVTTGIAVCLKAIVQFRAAVCLGYRPVRHHSPLDSAILGFLIP